MPTVRGRSISQAKLETSSSWRTSFPKTIRSSVTERGNQLRAELEALTRQFEEGGQGAFVPFRDLVQRLLSLTVAATGQSVRLVFLDRDRTKAVLTSGTERDLTRPMHLRGGGYLRLTMSLDVLGDRGHLRVREASFQYQTRASDDSWVFRYDFLREGPGPYPPAHLQVNGALPGSTPDLPARALPDVHFPTGRLSIEAVIRLLAEQCDVPTAEPSAVWRPVLAVSERRFLDRAHQPLSGPAE